MSEYDDQVLCRLANLESKLLEYDREIRRLDERILALDVKIQQLNTRTKGLELIGSQLHGLKHTSPPIQARFDAIGDVVDGIFRSID